MPILYLLKKLIKLLQSNISPNELAGGVVIGMFIGLTPFFSLINVIALIFAIILNVNFASVMFAIPVFSLIGLVTDFFADKIGYLLLVKIESLTPFWTKLYNMPIVPFTKFYNTVVLGNLVISIFIAIPVFLITKKLVVLYRTTLYQKIQNSKIYKWYKKLWIVNTLQNLYNKIMFFKQ
ncbi:MAG: TIGR03546 family protein [Endomicrobiia bacterium]